MTFLKTTALALVLSAGLFIGSSHASFRHEGDASSRLTRSMVTDEIKDIVGQSLATKQKATKVMELLIAHEVTITPGQVNVVKQTIDTASVSDILKGFGVEFDRLPEDVAHGGMMNSALDEEAKDAGEDVDKPNQTIADLEAAIKGAKDEIARRTGHMDDEDTRIAAAVEVKHEEAVAQIEDLAAKHTADVKEQFEASVKRAEQEIASKRAEQEIARTARFEQQALDLEALEAERVSLEAGQKEQQEIVVLLKKQIEGLKANAGTHLQEELKEINAELKSEVEELEKDLAKQAGTIATAESDLNLADEKREEAVAKVQALLDTALEEKDQLKADLEAAKKVKPAAVTDLVVDHREELDAVKAELAKVQAQLEDAAEEKLKVKKAAPKAKAKKSTEKDAK
jgi:chromosome segregation ATPase